VDVDGNGFITYDELAFVTRKRLDLKKKDLPDEHLKALWCVLDADDTNAIEVDEFARFLKGQVESLLEEGRMRKKPPPEVLERQLPPHLRPMRIKRPEERRFDFDEYLRRASAAHEKREADMVARLRAQKQKEARLAHENAKRIAAGRLNDERRRMIIRELHGRARSPIPSDNGGRLAAGKVLTLYEAERLLATSEIVEDNRGRIAFKPLWPGRRLSPPPSRGGVGDVSASSRTPLLDSLMGDQGQITSSGLMRPQWVDISPTPSPLDPPRPSSFARLRTSGSISDMRMGSSGMDGQSIGVPYRRSPTSPQGSRDSLSTPVQMALSRFEAGLLLKTDEEQHLLNEEQAQMLADADQSARAQGFSGSRIYADPKLRSTSSLPQLARPIPK